MEVKDTILIKKLKSHDNEEIYHAFKCLYEKYYKLIFYCINTYVNNKEDSEELTNDTFLNVFNNLHNLNENKNLKYYLVVTAKNNAISFLRKRKDDVIPIEHINKSIPISIDLHNDTLNKLKEFLNDEEVFIVVYHLIYGYSFKDISIIKNKSINTIMSTYRRAIKKSYKILKEANYE